MIWLREEQSQEAKPQAAKVRITSCLILIKILAAYICCLHICHSIYSLLITIIAY
jgi:hypothetical protein